MPEKTTSFPTPNGNRITLYTREPSSDESIVAQILLGNEYGIPTHYEGVGVDIGAHIGTWAIAACADNPGLAVVAIEAVYENVLMMRRNVALNDMGKRIKVLHRAAHSGNYMVDIPYAFQDTEETGTYHSDNRWIGGLTVDAPHEVQSVQGLRLTRLARFVKEPIRIMKIDCEGCEFHFLRGEGLKRVQEIVGEWHNGEPETIINLLSPTHDVRIIRNDGGIGLFQAVLR